ncbi:glycosyltransferase family 4 protein [Rhodococcoides kroppenstedtii]
MPHSSAHRDSGDRVRTETLVNVLRSGGHEVAVFYPRFNSSEQPASYEVAVDIPRHSLTAWRVHMRLVSLFDRFAIFEMAGVKQLLRSAVEHYDPDVVDIQHTHLWFDCRVPVVVTAHNIESMFSGRRGWAGWRAHRVREREVEALSRAAATVVFSSIDGQRARSLCSDVDPVVVVLGTGESASPHRIRNSIDAVGFIGSFDYLPNRQALSWLLAWWSSRGVSNGIESLILVGRSLSRAVSRVPASVITRSDVPDVVRSSEDFDVLIVPLWSGGGVRVKIIEALGRGLPVVCTPLACEGIEVSDGREVLLFDSADELDAVLGKLSSSNERARMSTAQRETWKAKYSADAMAGQLVDVYLSVCSAGTGN